MIGHELTAAYGLDHGQTLAIVAPQLWRQQSTNKSAKLLKFAHNVWGLENNHPDVAIKQAIIKTEEFFHSLGVKTKFADYGITVDADKIVANLFKYSSGNLGEHQNIDAVAVKEILTMAQ
jgi:NADP-dependent alcohol dehydrogenase